MSARLVTGIAELRRELSARRRPGVTIGMIPTMGALHDGHGSLLERARAECDVVVATIFVNAIQFNQASDYDRYPRTLDGDLAICEARGVDLVFAPDNKEMYPAPLDTHVEVGRLTDHLCGANRPGHFRGVTTVVAKLFHIAQPDRAYFGEKDVQQLAAIRRMVRDLNMPVEVVPVAIVREPDGLAMSSRNERLKPVERSRATILYHALRAAAKAVEEGEYRSDAVIGVARAVFAQEPAVELEYLEIVDATEMQPVSEITGPVCIAVAAWLGETRLIDNIGVAPS